MKFKVLIAMMGMEIGGAETHVLELCRALKRKGIDVYVASNGGSYERELTEAGVRHFKVPLHNRRVSSLFASFRLLKSIIRENNIRLVHAHARIPAFLCGLLRVPVIGGLRFTFVTTAHLNFTSTWYYRLLSNWGDAALAVSDDIKQYLVEQYKMEPGNIATTNNGIDTEKFSPNTDCGDVAREFSIEPDKRVIAYLSRMDADRSLPAHALIECAANIYAQNNDVEILIIGGGNDFGNIKAKAEAVNAELGRELIKLTDSRTDINKLIALCHIFIGGSRAALEAMAAGKPVILSHNQGHLGIFDETKLAAGIETNFCCRGHAEVTPALLENDVLTLLRNSQDKLHELGEYGRNVVLERYSMDAMAEDAVKLYNYALKMNDGHRVYDAVVSGYYGFKNHGDDALLKAIIDDLRGQNKDTRILVLSRRPKETARLFGVEAVNRYNLPLIARRIKRAKLLISGGGSLIQDGTSTRSLMYYLYIIKAAVRGGARVMLYANGIGPLHSQANKRRAAKVLNNADVITLRDSDSEQTLNTLGLSAPAVFVTADAAFGIKNTEPDRGIQIRKELGLEGKPFFCVAIRNWKTLPHDFEQKLAAFADGMAERHGVAALFLSMQPQTDTAVSKRVMGLMKQPAYFAGEDLTVNEVLGLCAEADFMVAMRLHAAIYAAKCAKPVIGLIYDPKVKGVLADFGQHCFIDVENIDTEVLLNFAREVTENAAAISQKLAEKSGEVERAAALNVEFAGILIKGHLY